MKLQFKACEIVTSPTSVAYKLEPGEEYPINISGTYVIIPDPNYGVFINLLGQQTLDDQGRELEGTFRLLEPFSVQIRKGETFFVGVPYSSLICTVYFL